VAFERAHNDSIGADHERASKRERTERRDANPMNSVRILGLTVVLLGWVLLGTGSAQDVTAQATELLIVPHNEEGERIRLSSAEVFLETWYGSRRVPPERAEREGPA